MLERGKMDRELGEFVVVDELVSKEHLLRKIDAATEEVSLNAAYRWFMDCTLSKRYSGISGRTTRKRRMTPDIRRSTGSFTNDAGKPLNGSLCLCGCQRKTRDALYAVQRPGSGHKLGEAQACCHGLGKSWKHGNGTASPVFYFSDFYTLNIPGTRLQLDAQPGFPTD